jgi:hypothetical protein
MYIDALNTFPYFKAAMKDKPSANAELIDEWRRVNADEAAKKAKARSAADEGAREEAAGV